MVNVRSLFLSLLHVLSWAALLLTPASVAGELDLPVAPPRLGDVVDAPSECELFDDDPRDTPPPTFYGEEIESETDTIVYILDRSGSMQNRGHAQAVDPDGKVVTADRWTRAKFETVKSIRGLSDNIRFNVYTYSCVIQRWSADLKEATSSNKSAAEAWVARQYWADGGTGTGPAVASALRDNQDVRGLVLLTDGEPNCGSSSVEGHRRMIASSNAAGATINVFGIQATGKWRAFCQAVASDSGGSYLDVP